MRKQYALTISALKSRGMALKHLSLAQKWRIARLWGWKYTGSKTFLILNTLLDKNVDIAAFMPQEFFLFKLHTAFNMDGLHLRTIPRGKNAFNRLFPFIKQPRTIARRINGEYLDGSYKPISPQEAEALCRQYGEVVIKKTVNTGGGADVFFLGAEEYDGRLTELLSRYDNLIVQDIIRQHPLLASLQPSSVNGLRLYVIKVDGECSVVLSYLKLGSGDSRMDNFSQGGVVCIVSEEGRILSGLTESLEITYVSPTGVNIKDLVIPAYDKCRELAVRGTESLKKWSNLMMIWDFAIDEEGEPVLIETTTGFTLILGEQICGVPFIADPALRDKIIAMVKNCRQIPRPSLNIRWRLKKLYRRLSNL